MNRQKTKCLVAAVLIGMMTVTTLAQEEQKYFREKIEGQFEQARLAGREAFLGLMWYPKDVREDMLEVAQYPELAVKLLAIRDFPLIQISEVLKPYPREVQEAAKTMFVHPEVLSILQDNLTVTGLVGAVYRNDKQVVKRLLNQIAERMEKGHYQTVDAWAERLQDNPEAVEQLKEAYKKYAAQTTEPDQLFWDTNFEVSEEGEVQVSDLPSAQFVTFILNSSDQYPYVCDQFLGHYGNYYHPYTYGRYEDYLDDDLLVVYPSRDFGETMKDWVEDRPHILPEEPPEGERLQEGVENRVEQLREQGKFDKAFEKARQQRENLDRGQFLRDNADRYPNLKKRVDQYNRRPRTPESARPTNRPQARTERRQQRQRVPSTQRAQVNRRPQTRQQSINRGQRNHQRSWQGSRGGTRRSSTSQRGAGSRGRSSQRGTGTQGRRTR